MQSTADTSSVQYANKVATLSLAFWVMKICATTVGETAGDILSMTWDIGYAASSIILLSLFVIALTLQLRAQLSSDALLDGDPRHEHGRHDDLGLHGPHARARLCGRLDDLGQHPDRAWIAA